MTTAGQGSSPNKLLLGCGALLVLILAFLFWWSRNPIVFTAPSDLFSQVVARQLEDPTGTAVVVELELSGETSGYTVTEISLGRELAERLGVSAPRGFQEELLPLADEEIDDPESVRFVEEWNEENLRWIGSLQMTPGTPVVVRIPATDPRAETGPLTVSYESVSLLGGHWSSTTVVLNAASESEAGQAMNAGPEGMD